MQRGAGAQVQRGAGAEGCRGLGRRERPEGPQDVPLRAFPEMLGKSGKGRPCRALPRCTRRSRSKGSGWNATEQSRQGAVFAPGVGSAALSVGAGPAGDVPSGASVSASVKWEEYRVVLPPGGECEHSTGQSKNRIRNSLTAWGALVNGWNLSCFDSCLSWFLKTICFIRM